MISDVRVVAVEADQWDILAWLWQAFRQDLAAIVGGYPYADGRYQAALLRDFPSADGEGYFAWRPHPNTVEEAPVGFALVSGLTGERRAMAAFWVAPPLRGLGFARQFARDVLNRHPGPWEIGFQHDNVVAGQFWRHVANGAFNLDWVEVEEVVPGKPTVPPDHFIRSSMPG